MSSAERFGVYRVMFRRSLIRILALVPSVGLIFPKEAAALPKSKREKATELFQLHYDNALKHSTNKLVAVSVSFGGEYANGRSYRDAAIRIPL